MNKVVDALNKGRKIVINRSEKANGENLQIAYESWTGRWIVASKNVTILVKDLNELSYYNDFKTEKDKESNETDRFHYVCMFATRWFKILETMKEKNLYSEFIEIVDGFTLVGEHLDLELQHIKLYPENDIHFYSIVDNYSDKICETVEYTKNLFNKFGLKLVNVNYVDTVDNLQDFYHKLEEVYLYVLRASVELEGEGNVVYISMLEEDKHEEVISLAKLKTFEYRVLRKLREKLKTYYKNIGKFA